MIHLFRLTVLLGFAAAASAATVNGLLVDKMCSAKVGKDQKAAAGHTRECAQMPPCEKSGYGVLTADGKYLTLDDAGNSKAVEALKTSKKKDNLKVRIDGDVTGDSIKVTGLRLQ